MFLFILLLLPISVFSTFVCPKIPVLLRGTFEIPEDAVAPGSTCQFMVSYPPISSLNATYALVSITTEHSTLQDIVFVSDNFGNDISMTPHKSPFVFSPPSLTFTIKTGQNSTMQLGISITAVNFNPSGSSQNSYVVASNVPAKYIDIRQMSVDQSTLIQSIGNKVFLSVATLGDLNSEALMNVFVYDGKTDEDSFIGTLFNVFKSGHVVSRLWFFTLYCVTSINIDGLVMVTDQTNIAQYSSYNVIWSEPTSMVFNHYLMLADKGRTALTVVNKMDYSNSMYLTGVSLSPNDTSLTAYAQTPLANSSLMLPLVDYKNGYPYLPQHFDSNARTFVLEKGNATLEFTTDKSNSKDSVAYDGRNGFIASHDYGIQSTNLNSSPFELHSESSFTVTFMIMAGAPRSQLNIYDYDSQQTYVIPFNIQTFQIPFTAQGSNFAIAISSNSTQADIGSFLYYYIIMDTEGTTTVETTTRGAYLTTNFISLIIAVFTSVYL